MRQRYAERHENLGAFAQVMRQQHIPFDYLATAAGERLQRPLSDYSHVVILGGCMGAYETEKHPFLNYDRQLIETALDQDIPLVGVCLGAQLLAQVLGSRVYPGTAGSEVGWHQVELTAAAAEDPLFAGLPTQMPAFQWHSDTFDLPTGATRLATGDRYLNQAYRYGRKAWGIQFHLEVDGRVIHNWLHEVSQLCHYNHHQLSHIAEATASKVRHYNQFSHRFMAQFLGVAIHQQCSAAA
ncbi:MAG: type 1 glutamine amidotransferase [Synechococcaceae cyanobacterium SM2_3_60]|nr:type 1 glutamine amidotransferase [Synechococcaceae cyanobacterium SM2_3_60]